MPAKIAVSAPVEELIVAPPEAAHTPPGVPLAKPAVAPIQMGEGPVIDAGVAFTVTTVDATVPHSEVKEITAVPAVTPVINPDESTVATPALPLDHVPLCTEVVPNCDVSPEHTTGDPKIVPASEVTTTLAVVVTVHPSVFVTVTEYIPLIAAVALASVGSGLVDSNPPGPAQR